MVLDYTLLSYQNSRAASQYLSVSVVFYTGKRSKINFIFIYKYKSVFGGSFVPFLTETLRQ